MRPVASQEAGALPASRQARINAVEGRDRTALSFRPKISCGPQRTSSELSHSPPFASAAADETALASALRAGDLDLALRHLREAGERQPIAEVCRLGEALFHAGRRADALVCGRVAFARAGDDRHIADFCAWLFSNCGMHEAAALAYERLIDLDPFWVEGHRHASGSYAAIGRLDRAMDHAVAASELAPYSTEFAAHAAELLLRAGRVEDAAGLAAAAADRLGDDPVLWRTLSAAEMLRGRLDDALLAIDAAIALAPEIAEYRLHRAHLRLRLGDPAGAAAACDAAAALDPQDAAVKRLQLELLLADGQVTEATALAGVLMQQHPEDDQSAEAARHVLDHRLDAIGGDYVVLREAGAASERRCGSYPVLPSGCAPSCASSAR